MNPWFVMLLGMGTVFFGLFCLILLSKLMSLVIKAFDKKAEGAKAEVKPAVAAAVPAGIVNIPDRKQFDAIVAAAIATYLGTDIAGLRIRSVRSLSQNGADRKQFVAAVSAAVATTMGTEVSGLRIHSIKKI